MSKTGFMNYDDECSLKEYLSHWLVLLVLLGVPLSMYFYLAEKDKAVMDLCCECLEPTNLLLIG